VDNVPAYFTTEVLDNASGTVKTVGPEEVARRNLSVLDVRGAAEYREGHIPGAVNIPMGYVLEHIADIPRDEPLAVHCEGGTRSQAVISLLQKHGFTNLMNMVGGVEAWEKAGLPVERGD
jgi:hydroxyacylglutathione hydrolase